MRIARCRGRIFRTAGIISRIPRLANELSELKTQPAGKGKCRESVPVVRGLDETYELANKFGLAKPDSCKVDLDHQFSCQLGGVSVRLSSPEERTGALVISSS